MNGFEEGDPAMLTSVQKPRHRTIINVPEKVQADAKTCPVHAGTNTGFDNRGDIIGAYPMTR